MNNSEYKKRNLAIWNEIAPRYHKRWASVNDGPFQSTQKLVKLMKIKKNDRVLDLACGTGVVTQNISNKLGGSGFVIGGDTSLTAIKIAKRWNTKNNNLDFINLDAERFYFAAKFDVITCQYALFFFPNAQKALRNMRDHLVDKGRIGIAVHGNNVPFFDSILNAVTKFIPDYSPIGTPNLDRFGTKNALSNEVRKAGFRGIDVKSFVFSYNPGRFEDYWRNYLRYIPKPLKEKISALESSQKKKLRDTVKVNTKQYTRRDENIEFPWQVLILTAKK